MKLTVLTGITAVLVLVFIFELVRRRQLREKYALLWLGVGLAVAVLGFFPHLLDSITHAVGVASGVSLVLFLGIVFLLLVCLHLSWESSRMEEETRALSEELALLRTQVSAALSRATGEPDPLSPAASDAAGTGLAATAARTDQARLVRQAEPQGHEESRMINGKRVLIVIPAWNESASIGDVIHELRGELPEVDVLVVDDGSTDRTAKIAAAAGATVARLPYNLGVGGARRLGYKYAREHEYDVVVQLDADGQHDPRYVPKLIDALDEADLVIGARFAGEGEYRVRGPRRWAMTMLNVVLSRVAKTRLTDTTSGFRASNKRTTALFAEFFPVEYLGDTIEVLVHAVHTGHVVRQVPVTMRPRQAGVPSHSPIKSTVYLGRAFFILLLSLVRR